MKFAKEIEDEAVPEWRDKYLDYKAGKKLIKHLAKAVKETGTPPAPLLPPSPSSTPLLLPLPEPALDLPQRRRTLGSRLKSHTGSRHESPKNATGASSTPVALHARPEVESKKQAFVDFLDRHLETVEDFYREKEEESTERLGNIREQLHLLRAQRSRERTAPQPRAVEAMKPFGRPIKSAVKRVRFGGDPQKKQSKSPSNFTPPNADLGKPAHQQDYVRKPVNEEVSYSNAKRHLKRAMVEFYRSLELLKSYALVNHKAFRKINKKYDKAVHTRQPMRYFNEKIAKAYFVRSEVIDSHIKAVEDLYARYFERESHKIAVGKLRRRQHDPGEYISSVFRNGLMLAAGVVLGLEGLYFGADRLFNADPVTKLNTSYLLQIYGGYFLMLLLMVFFVADCAIFEKKRINFVFVFELDVRHSINWRQMFELPCLFTFLLGLIILLNFRVVGGPDMYIYWPVVLIGLTLLMVFLPIKYFYWRSRLWFANSLRRLAMSPIPRVEFRDFFLGDMFCSQAYAMGNIELFFCLYANNWNNPGQCNSTHSRLLGFFSALPGIWRFLQCLRRYRDTRNIFPHLVNGGKYTFTFMQYATLSLYRISGSDHTFAAFIAVATINSVYCFVWDVIMDWSLGNSKAPYPYLRPQLGYQSIWWIYYIAIVEDFVLRFNWIFYAIFRNDVQHSAVLSFFIGLSEVVRRGVWVLLRVENEHCSNIAHHRAIKDMSLPYEPPITPDSERRNQGQEPELADEESNLSSVHPQGSSVNSGMGRYTSHGSPSTRKSPSLAFGAKSPSISSRVQNALSRAHTQDFERKRDQPDSGPFAGDGSDSDDDDDDMGAEHDSDVDYHEQDALAEAASQQEEIEAPDTGTGSEVSALEEEAMPAITSLDEEPTQGSTKVQVRANKPPDRA